MIILTNNINLHYIPSELSIGFSSKLNLLDSMNFSIIDLLLVKVGVIVHANMF